VTDAPRVKICGLTSPQDLAHAVEAGADYVGLVFAPSSRQVEVEAVADWLEEARGAAEVVGVFRDERFARVVEIVETLDLDFVQLHGSESGPEWSQLPVRLIEARVVRDSVLPPARFPGASWADLLDGGAGEGRGFPWELAAPVTRERRVFLAGGLDPENVAAAVAAVGPFAVDVSSGVEAHPGRKDAAKVARFVAAAKGVAG